MDLPPADYMGYQPAYDTPELSPAPRARPAALVVISLFGRN
jgi:hypothetical protein